MSDIIHRESRGVFIIAATPFTEDGALDLDSVDRLTEFYLGHGVTGMTVLGIMGEAAKLSGEEAETYLARVLGRVAGRVPVVVGASGGGFGPMARVSARAMELGAAGVMVAPPAGTDTEEKLAGYYAGLCEALGPEIPLCVQDFPQVTGVRISAATIHRLARAHAQIVMLKHEDWPGLTKLERVRQGADAAGAPRLSILCGNGGLFLPEELSRGADGAMTGFAYPEMLVGVVARHRAGDVEGAHDLFDAYLPLVRYEQQLGLGLAARKEVLRRRGAIASARVRAPGPKLTASDQADLTRLMARLEQRLVTLGEAA